MIKKCAKNYSLNNFIFLWTLQAVYSLICFVCALFDWNEEVKQIVNAQCKFNVFKVIHRKQIKSAHVPSYWRQTKLHRICDFMYTTSVFPVGMVGLTRR